MSNEQKLREALRIAVNYIDMDALYTFAGGDHDTIKEALATTEPEPTGMPELHAVAHIELGDDSHDVVTLEAAKAYGEQCWKAGYKHGAWADKPDPTSKQSLQVEPAVNQQLTTEPVDEREAFTNDTKDAKRYRWLADSNNYYEAINLISDRSLTLTEDALGKAIDAAMAKGVKG